MDVTYLIKADCCVQALDLSLQHSRSSDSGPILRTFTGLNAASDWLHHKHQHHQYPRYAEIISAAITGPQLGKGSCATRDYPSPEPFNPQSKIVEIAQVESGVSFSARRFPTYFGEK